MENFPIQTVTSWLGNSPTIALRHSLQTTEAHFEEAVRADSIDTASDEEKATQNPTQRASAMGGIRSQTGNENRKNPQNNYDSRAMALAGLGDE